MNNMDNAPLLPPEIVSHILAHIQDCYTYYSFALCSWWTWQLARRLGLDRPAALQALVDACAAGDTELVQKIQLCQLYPDSDTLAEASAAAAHGGHTAVLQLLHQAGQLVKEQVLHRGSAASIGWFRCSFPRNAKLARQSLMLAASEGNAQRVQALLSTFTHLSHPHVLPYAFRRAAGRGHLSVLQALPSVSFDRLSLLGAAREGHLAVLVWLYELWQPAPKSRRRQSTWTRVWQEVAEIAEVDKNVAMLRWLAHVWEPARLPPQQGQDSAVWSPGALQHWYGSGRLSRADFLSHGWKTAVEYLDLELAKQLHAATPLSGPQVEELWGRLYPKNHPFSSCSTQFSMLQWLHSLQPHFSLYSTSLYSMLRCYCCDSATVVSWLLTVPGCLPLVPAAKNLSLLCYYSLDAVHNLLQRYPAQRQIILLQCCSILARRREDAQLLHLLPLLSPLQARDVPVPALCSPVFMSWLLQHGVSLLDLVAMIERERPHDLSIYENLHHCGGMAWDTIFSKWLRLQRWRFDNLHFGFTFGGTSVSALRRLHAQPGSLTREGYTSFLKCMVAAGNISELQWCLRWKPFPRDFWAPSCLDVAIVQQKNLFFLKWLLQTFPDCLSKLSPAAQRLAAQVQPLQ